MIIIRKRIDQHFFDIIVATCLQCFRAGEQKDENRIKLPKRFNRQNPLFPQFFVMTSYALPQKTGCLSLPVLVTVLGLLVALCLLYLYLIDLERRITTIYTYEKEPEGKYLVGGNNESYAGLCETFIFIEADMDVDSFNRFAKLEKKHFLSIGENGIYITCFKFKSIHPSQKNSFDSYIGDDEWHNKLLPDGPSSCKPWRDIWYQHHVATGLYFIEDASDVTFQGDKTLFVYDAENCRMFQFTGSPSWISVPSR